MDKSVILIFSIIGFGYFFAYKTIERNEIEKGLNKYLYYIALPFTIFLKTAGLKTEIVSLNFALINSIPIMFVYFLIYIFWKTKIFSSNFSRTLAVTSTLGNLVYLGLSVISFTQGEEFIGIGAVVAVIQNLVIFTAGVFFLNIICEDGSCLKIFFSKIIKNPLLASSILGILWSYFSLPVPDFIMRFLTEFSKSVTSIALFTVGLGLYGKKITFLNINKILVISFFKLIFLPLVVFGWIYFTGESDINYKIVFIQYTMPVAVACYVLAYEFNLEYDVVAQSILFTTILYFVLYPFYNALISLLF